MVEIFLSFFYLFNYFLKRLGLDFENVEYDGLFLCVVK